MTDQTTPVEEPVVIAAAEVTEDGTVTAEGAVAIQGATGLLVASFADPAAAEGAYEALRAAESEKALKIDGVLVVDADADGKINIRKLTDHHTRRGTKWGVVAGGALALIFPPSILAGAVAGGVIGAVIGKVGNVVTRGQVAGELSTVVKPGTSGIVAILDLSDLEQVKATIPEATEVRTVAVDAETAASVTAAAQAVEEPVAG